MSTAPTEPAPPQPAAATSAAGDTQHAPRRRGRLVVRIGLLGGCLCGGLAGGMTVQATLRHEEPPELPAAAHPAPSEEHAADLPHDPAGAIDTLIRAGYFRDALKLCRAGNPAHSADDRALAYREALCLEALGRWKEAANTYRRDGGSTEDVGLWGRAVLGQVRCALANDNPTEAGELLSQVISRHEASADRHVLGECLHLQARLALLELGPAAALDPFDTDALAWPPLDGGLDRYPDWLGIGEESHQSGFVAQIVNTLLATEVEKTTHSHEMVANLLRRALAAAPNHPAARAVRVTLANFDFRAGRLSEANRAYRQILDGSPHAPEALHAAYNLGLIELRQLDPHAAQARFLEVIDRGPGTRWADYAWWWIARSHLDAGDAAAAQKPLHTALAGKTKEVASAAALGLCACHLLEGDDEGARAVLRTHRVGTREAHAALAEFFEALVRFRSSPSESRGETLLAALGIVDEGRPLGATGVLLTGQAYRDLGLHERAVRLYDAGAAAFRGSLAVRMTFETAERFDRLDLRREARQRYLAVTVMDPRGLGPRAALRVADIAARDGKGSECVSRCRELIDQPGVELAEVLAVMGHGYELQGKYRLAAECFAGRVPAE